MTPTEEIISIGKARHGDNWKHGLAGETGWSWWTFNRLDRGGEADPKLVKAVKNLKARRKPVG